MDVWLLSFWVLDKQKYKVAFHFDTFWKTIFKTMEVQS